MAGLFIRDDADIKKQSMNGVLIQLLQRPSMAIFLNGIQVQSHQ